MKKIIVTVLISALFFLPIGFGLGFAVGFFSSDGGRELAEEFAQDFATGITAVERPADVENPKQIMGQRFLFKHPGNWWVDTEEDAYDPEGYFTIYSPGQSYTVFDFSYSEVDAQEQLKSYAEYYEQDFEMKTVESFDSWAGYEGLGKRMEGSILGDKFYINIFCYESEHVSFTMTESFESTTDHHTKPGFEQIESTFELFESPEEFIE